MISIKLADKSDKKNIIRFYKAQRYSASFIGYDKTYLAINELDNSVVGIVIVSFSNNINQQGLLHGLFVKAEYRHQAIARKLLHTALKSHNQIICFAATELSSFYQKMGFNPTTIHEAFIAEVNLTRFNAYQKNMPSLAIFIHKDSP